jgi:hypothetical protein
MSNDAPALNADSTLKDASEIEWAHSPSADPTFDLPETSKKHHHHAHSTDMESDSDSHTLPSAIGLKDKVPACHAGGKRVKMAMAHAQESSKTLTPCTRHFFSSNFIGTYNNFY